MIVKKLPTVTQIIRAKFSGKSPELARMIGVSNVTAWSWLNGKHLPSRKYANKICKVLGIRLSRYMKSYENDWALSRQTHTVPKDLFTPSVDLPKPNREVVEAEYVKHSEVKNPIHERLNHLVNLAETLSKLDGDDKEILKFLMRHSS